MATTERSLWRKGATWSQFGGLFREVALRPTVLLFFALAATVNLWIGGAVYALLTTFLVTPGGFLVWLVSLAAVATFLGGLGFTVIRVLRDPTLKAARACFRAGDFEGYAANLETRRTMLRSTFRWHEVSMLASLLIAPACIALVLGSGNPTLVRDHGRLRHGSRREEVRATLRWMEGQGVFAWPNRVDAAESKP